MKREKNDILQSKCKFNESQLSYNEFQYSSENLKPLLVT